MREKFERFKALTSPLTAFFIGTALTCCAYSVLSSILGIRLSLSGVSTSRVGIVLAFYYVGYVVAAKTAHKIINKVGHVRSFTAFLSIFSSLTLLHYFSEEPVFWGALRLAEGYCIGAATMCLESWLNSRATNRNRGVIMSLYMVTTYLGSSLGQLFLNVPDPNGVIIYLMISILFSIALVPISLTALPTPDISMEQKSMSLKQLYKKTPVGVLGCFTSGIINGAFFTIGTVFTEKAGMTIHQTSLWMFSVILGGMLAQIPMGRLSDKMDRRLVMMGCYSALFLVAPIFKFIAPLGTTYICIGGALMGFFMFVMYPISVSHINDLIADDERVHASGKLIMIQGTGLVLGPIIIGFVMEHFGVSGFLLSYSAFALIFVLFTLKHINTKPEVSYVTVTPTTPVPVGVTQMFDELATKDSFVERVKKSKRRKQGYK